MHWTLEGLLWLAAVAAAVVLASALAFRSWYHFAERARGPAGQALPPEGPATPLDRLMAAAAATAGGANTVASLLDNVDAFAARVQSVRQAGRSLDVMTYIWRTDLTGWLLLREVLDAADRGVRVRLLLDDLYVQGIDPVFLALSQHPNIEVRLFNPFRNRGHLLRRGLEAVLGLTRYNRRLHGKTWTADGRLAIVGGRNIGDTYFFGSGIPGGVPGGSAGSSGTAGSSGSAGLQAGQVSRDADLMLSGPAVGEIDRMFDGYWNLGLVLPIRALLPHITISLRRFRRRLRRHSETAHARGFLDQALAGRDAAAALTGRLSVASEMRVLADPPDKAYGRRSAPWMADEVHALLAAARHEVRLINPYFVPGEAGMAELIALRRRGVAVLVLTNALSVSDNIAVHGAYRQYRARLLAAGVRIHEFAPPPVAPGRPRDVLHSKVFIIDRKTAIVGSLNFDQRSADINAELGIWFEEPGTVQDLLATYDADSGPDMAYALSLQDSAIRWDVTRPGLPAQFDREPETGVLRRAISCVAGHLPIHGWL